METRPVLWHQTLRRRVKASPSTREDDSTVHARFQLQVDSSILQLAPSFAGIVLYVEGLSNGPSDEWSSGLLCAAESRIRDLGCSPADHPHMRAWSDVYRS